MLWNIPADGDVASTSTSPSMSQLPDGTRQISATGPYYRGPGAPASGPAHHYVFELFALDTTIDVPAVGASPPATRAAVVAAMAGHVRGKAVLVGLFKRKLDSGGIGFRLECECRPSGLPDTADLKVRTTSNIAHVPGFAPVSRATSCSPSS